MVEVTVAEDTLIQIEMEQCFKNKRNNNILIHKAQKKIVDEKLFKLKD